MSDWLQAYAGDAVVAQRLSDTEQLTDMLRIEAAFSRALGQAGVVTEAIAEDAAKAILTVKPDLDALQASVLKNGLPVPGLVDQIKRQVSKETHSAIHTGLTSQDVMDTALVLALRDILKDFDDRIAELQSALTDLNARFGANKLMGRTRMQAALEIGAQHRIAQWAAPWPDHRARLDGVRARALRLQFGGPVGTRGSFGVHQQAIASAMARELDLPDPGSAWHSDRSALAELAAWLAGVTGSLGKVGADLSLMAQQGIDEVKMQGGGASSAMAHKSNPVQAELLVTLAHDSAGQLGLMYNALVHEQERSGVAWALEWLALPRLLHACGAALRTGCAVIANIEEFGTGSSG